MGARKYEDLAVWRLCEELRRLVIAGTATGPGAGDRKFCHQIRDAAEDAVSDVAEGFGRFRPREFARFIGYAITSNTEVRERTRFAHGRRYFSDEAAARITVLSVRAPKALKAFRTYLWNVSPDDVPYAPAASLRRKRRGGRKPMKRSS